MVTLVDNHEHYWGPVSMDIHDRVENSLSTSYLVTYQTCLTCGAVKNHAVGLSSPSYGGATIAPDSDGHYHCWHSKGNVLMTYPPQYPMVCCHCGEIRNFSEKDALKAPQTITHGVHQ